MKLLQLVQEEVSRRLATIRRLLPEHKLTLIARHEIDGDAHILWTGEADVANAIEAIQKLEAAKG